MPNALKHFLNYIALLFLAPSAYSFQTFAVLEVLTASKMNQVEVNIRDHQHGVSSVSSSGMTFASPTFSGTVGGAVTWSGAQTYSAAMTYGGVTLANSVTGTGSMMLSASPTTTGTLTGAAANFSGALAVSPANAAAGIVLTASTGANAATQRFVNDGGTYTIGVDNSTGSLFGSVHAMVINVASGRVLNTLVNGTEVTRVSSTGLSVTGETNSTAGINQAATGGFVALASIAPSGTTGHFYVTCGAGAPSGVPNKGSGAGGYGIAMYYDTTNDYLYVYRGGWKKSAVYA